MSTLDNSEYYRQRAEQAGLRAREATLPEVRRVHAEMAERYAILQQDAERDAPPCVVRPVTGIDRTG